MPKFEGTLEEFKQAIDALSMGGSWEEFTLGLRYRTKDGGVIQWYNSTKNILIQGNERARANLVERIGALGSNSALADVVADIPFKKHEPVKKIFLVHGHDTTSLDQLELIILKLGLQPFILANSSGGGLTIIEALEAEIGNEGDSAFGIVLLTPDDIGYAQADGESKAQSRARQNVVLEMGMLIAAVGRRNTVILKKGHLEVPSDAGGIIYLPFNNHVKEVVPRLVEILERSGFTIEAGRVAKAAS